MTRLAQFHILMVALLALGGCSEKESLGSDNLSPSQACTGKRCGDPCAACSTDACTTADVVGYCGVNGSCAAATPSCSLGTGGAGGGSAGAGGGAPGTGRAGSGGSVGALDAGTSDAPAQCEYEGKIYNLGDQRSLSDCNYCVCQDWYGTVQFSCTSMICNTGGAPSTGGKAGTGGTIGTGGKPGTGGAGGTGGIRDGGTPDGSTQCEYQGKLYNAGEIRPPSDCNTCYCWEAGAWACTDTFCGSGGTLGTGGKAGAGGTTGTGGSTGTCGDPVVKARYSSCMATKDEQSCTTMGGTWNTFSASNGMCMCPTGEAGCPCTKRTDCLALCAAKAINNSCIGVTAYECTSLGGGGGCWCLTGESEEICIN